MFRFKRWWRSEKGGVSMYLMMILLPLLLFLGLLIDVLRWKTADQEAELAVKAGVRSVMSAYSKNLQAYGLYAIETGTVDANGEFAKTVSDNLSDSAGADRFVWMRQELVPGTAKVTPIYPLSNHQTMRQQILEEMKYRAPLNFALEIVDKFQKNGVAAAMGDASRFGERASKVEALIGERDKKMNEAWQEFAAIKQKSADITPFYQTQLRDLNELSARIGVHTLEDTRLALQQAKAQATALQNQIRSIDGSINSLAQAGAGAVQAIAQLAQSRAELASQYQIAMQTVTQYEELIANFVRYGEQLLVLQGKTALDQDELHTKLIRFQQAFKQTVLANDALNAEMEQIKNGGGGSSTTAKADDVFARVQVIGKQELDQWEADAGGAVAQFSGFHAQMNDGIWFTQQKYANTIAAVEGSKQTLDTAWTRMSPEMNRRSQSQKNIQDAKREQRAKTQAVLDQVRRGIGACSLVSGVDPYESLYHSLQGNPATPGVKGYFQTFMEMNRQQDNLASVPTAPLDDPDQAGLSALKLASGLENVLSTVRDEYYIDDYAVSKFSYRTLGMEKDSYGRIRTSKELSMPEQHPLANQEVEYMIYGAASCAGNYSLAYAEMFAFRLAIGVAEALLAPDANSLAAGSPLLVLLAAVAEGAVQAQQDMALLIQGDSVPVSKKLSSAIALSYKDYLRIFLLLHSKEAALLSRIQALVYVNTGVDLTQTATYLSGSASTAFSFWFMRGVTRLLGNNGFAACGADKARCSLSKTADLRY
ncbi:hypothetical protein [Paenibacillus sp.]|uniref:hypothetical protein n=1 Tax=Paenibacillus sp. TaxID=58172 RepID=UPI003564B73F